jgi:predicted RNA-binding Zn ribbon-like protein
MSRVASRAPVQAQLTGRRSLADLVWVANTGHGPAAHWYARPGPDEPPHDHLLDAADARRYLTDHHVEVPDGLPPPSQLDRLSAVRGVVRDLAEGRDGWQEPFAQLLEPASFQLTPTAGIASRADGWEGFVDDLLVPLLELVRRGERVSVCANPACRLVFVDDSRNRSRRWCDNAGCGNRVRVRRYRATHVEA